ncbi:hypothetical protein AB0D04_03700 [Streptomyces sp. NPDC048483]|uniref:hypothetical protein n=1 Tax=Streptomyces sp. NPDC048483 TaxID=3154927 RepID=UPI0034304039
MNDAYPFTDGRNLAWELEGFDTVDEWLRVCVSLTQEQLLSVRDLFALGEDIWMMRGVYPVPPGIWQSMEERLGGFRFEEGIDYFLGAHQNLPDGRLWRPAPGTQAPGPIPPP